MRSFIINKLGGYSTIQEAIDAIDSQKDKHTILTKAVSDIFQTVGDNDILRFESGQWLYQGLILDEQEVMQLKAEAQTFRKLRLYEVLDKEVKYHAARKMYYKSQTIDDLMAGKMIEYVWDIIKTKLKQLH